MTTINSADALQKRNANLLQKNVNEQAQQAQAATAASFAQQLANASSGQNSTSTAPVSTALSNAASSAMDVGVNLGSHALPSSGLSNSDFLSQSLKSNIEKQFNTLGKEIAISFIAGLTGQNNAVQSTPEAATVDTKIAPETSAKSLTDKASDINAAASSTADGATTTKAADTDEIASTTEEATASSAQGMATDATAEDDLQSSTDETQTASSSGSFSDSLVNFFESLESLSFLNSPETAEKTDQETDESTNDPTNTVAETTNETEAQNSLG